VQILVFRKEGKKQILAVSNSNAHQFNLSETIDKQVYSIHDKNTRER